MITLRRPVDPARPQCAHVVRAALTVSGHALQSGDAVTLKGESELRVSEGRQAEVMVFDLAVQAAPARVPWSAPRRGGPRLRDSSQGASA